jgi:hypothetical protein
MRFASPTVLLPALGAGILAASLHVMPATAAAAPTTIDMTAKISEFNPTKVETHVGSPTTLHITILNGTHGMASDDLGIPAQLLRHSEGTVDIAFTPAKAGTFDLHCKHTCGPDHDGMHFAVQVDP